MVRTTVSVQYDDIQSHTYSLCHHCWAITRRRLLFLMVSPFLLCILYMVGLWLFVDRPSGTTFLVVLATFLVTAVIVVALAKSREPWHRLKRLAVEERGGPPFVVFEGSEDGSNIILPV